MTAVWRASLVTTAAVAAAALGGCQRSEAAPPRIDAVMHVVNNRPIVDAELITRDGSTRRMRLLVDTSADGLVFSRAFAGRIGLDLGERSRNDDGVFAATEIGAVRIGRTRLDIGGTAPLVALETSAESLSGVDALIGAGVLRRYERVTMNFPAERITLGEPVAPPIGVVVPTTFDEGRVTARITLGSRNYRLSVDSGSVTTHVGERVPIRVTGTRQGVWGRIVLAPFEVVSDPDESAGRGRGTLGGNLLSRYTLRFDYENETLRVSTT